MIVVVIESNTDGLLVKNAHWEHTAVCLKSFCLCYWLSKGSKKIGIFILQLRSFDLFAGGIIMILSVECTKKTGIK